MRYGAIFFLLGRLLFIVGGFLLLPAMVAAYYHEGPSLNHFLYTALSAGISGIVLLVLCRPYRDEGIGIRDGFLLVTLSWVIISFFGAFPFYTSQFFPHFIDAVFESVSGFTTTGASVLSDIESLPRSLIFWRSLTQWIGGMGIIVLAVAILPQLSIGGMQLMKNEMPGPTFEQLKPRIKQTAMSLWKIYVLFSLLEILVLYLLGMSLFDSICHMFATMSTGGFSPYNASVAAFSNPMIQLTICLFMFLAGINFVLHYSILRGNFQKVITDTEWRFYVSLLGVAFVLVAANLMVQYDYSFLKSLRLSLFQVLSITTTTGFATDNFDVWPHLSRGLLFVLMFVGGCAGSTSGGMKQVRLLLLFKRAKQSIIQHIFPKAIVSIKLCKRAIPESVLHGVSAFFLIYIVIFSFATLVLLAFNIDFVTATSAVVASLSNIGPGFGLVGASQNYALLPAFVKCLLCVLMIVGRLEIFTVLVLLFPATWKK